MVFKITATGTLTTLHSFNNTDGGYPAAGLVQASDGTFCGTTGPAARVREGRLPTGSSGCTGRK